LTEALAHAKGKANGLRLYQPQAVDVANLGRRLSLTQKQFAARFGFSVATLSHWERGNRSLSGVSLVLLNVIGLNPEAMFEALQWSGLELRLNHQSIRIVVELRKFNGYRILKVNRRLSVAVKHF